MTLSTDVQGLDLAALLRPGDHIVWGQACGEPTTLVEALIAQAESIGRLSAFAATSFSGILGVESATRLNLSSMGAIGALRTVAATGRLKIVPCHVSQVGTMIEQGLIGCDVAFVQVSPPDGNGNHSFGLVSDFVQAAVHKARVVIAEVNQCVPLHWAMRSSQAHGSTAPFASRVLRSRSSQQRSAKRRRSPKQRPAILRTEPCFRSGSARCPIHLASSPRSASLGVHSGMIGDGLVDLVEAGVIPMR